MAEIDQAELDRLKALCEDTRRVSSRPMPAIYLDEPFLSSLIAAYETAKETIAALNLEPLICYTCGRNVRVNSGRCPDCPDPGLTLDGARERLIGQGHLLEGYQRETASLRADVEKLTRQRDHARACAARAKAVWGGGHDPRAGWPYLAPEDDDGWRP